MSKFQNRRGLVIIALLLMSLFALSACGSDSDGTATDTTPTDTTTADTTADTTAETAAPDDDPALAAFCEANTKFADKASPQGSPEHIADLQELLLSATDEVKPSLTIFTEFVAGGGIDPADPAPASEWPADVQAASTELFTYATANCK